jgi:chaperonin cofactor prefoldin
MVNYCEDLADSFKRLERRFKALAKQYRQAKRQRLAEICEQLADEHDRVADRLNELRKAYEKLEKALRH